MTKPALAPLTVPAALAACNAAEAALYAAEAATLQGVTPRDKAAQKTRLDAAKKAQAAYGMALLNLHRAHKMTGQEMTS